MLQVETPSGIWSALSDRVLGFLKADLIELNVDGVHASGFRSPDSPALWIRDHSDIMRGGKYMHADVKSAVDLFGDYQSQAGRVFDYVTTKAGTEPENWEKWVRVPVEADVEFRFIKAAYLAWQASGDDAWIASQLPRLEAAMVYATTHPWRWDDQNQLFKRAYTADTWDFDYTAGRNPWLNFEITDHTFWGIMHGDSSGYYEAALLLAYLYERSESSADATRWRDWAAGLRQRANGLLFNGRFYTHFHKLTPVTVEGVDEAEQLSLSNAMGINRGMATREIAIAILDEYKRRRDIGESFAEWFSIDPPFPHGHFGEEKIVPGSYCNGGVMPLVGGEIARAAFEHGREAYGLEILTQYATMVEESGETYLWYFPDGSASSEETSTSPDAMPTDGWGASSMLYALVEGLAGIEDTSHSYHNVRCSPRWAVTDDTQATVRAAYEATGSGFGYTYSLDDSTSTVRLELEAVGSGVDLHLLLPEGTRPTGVTWNGASSEWDGEMIAASSYVNASGYVEGSAVVEVTYGRS